MTNKEFDYMLTLKKIFVSGFEFPKLNSRGTKDLMDDEKNKYILDFQYGSVGKFVITLLADKAKQKWQLRSGTPLIRIDVNGSPHMLPDGEILKNHIHIFYPDGVQVIKLEDYSDDLYKSLKPSDVLSDFFRQCNIQANCVIVQEEL